MPPIQERLSPLDSAFLELEQADDGAMMHTGAALIFDPEPGSGGPPSLERRWGCSSSVWGCCPALAAGSPNRGCTA